MSVRRRLLHFGVLGALLFAGKRVMRPASGDGVRPLVVVVARGANADEVRRAAEAAVLVEEAVRAGWPLRDPVVQERMREVMEAGGTGAGLPAVDPATRARLAWLGRELVRARVGVVAPSGEELEAYRAAHPGRYAPGWLAFRQRTVSRARHGDAAAAEAAALVVRLGGADAIGGDPTMLPARFAGTAAAVDGRFGAGFAAAIAAAPVGSWSGPYAGTFGFHVVWREPAAAPRRDDEEVSRDWSHDQREANVRIAIDALIRARRVELHEVAVP